MSKFLFESKYTSEGAKALAREGGTARCAAVAKMIEGIGGIVECMYFAFGDNDVYTIVDLPDSAGSG